MSNTKTVMSQAANTQGIPLDITDVFSTYLYKANSTARSITNGIDLAGEGGLVWLKSRSSTREHALYDTERGVEKLLKSNSTGVQQNTSGGLTAFNSDGFSLGTYADVNGTSYGDFASWSFLKADKFFDVQTWTGDGVAGRTISHNLGSVPGMIIVKRTNSASDWTVYHRGAAADPETDALFLNTTAAANDHPSYWNDTAPTDTVFSVGNGSEVNSSSGTYVAYIFAHNDGDGEFGPSGDQDIIKCGGYTANGSSQEIDLGFEAQWVLLKAVDGSDANFDFWHLTDSMRGMPVLDSTSAAPVLRPDLSSAESTGYSNIRPTAKGFAFTQGNAGENQNGKTYIYMAIRRGPLNPPEAGTEVFAVDNGNGSDSDPTFISNFPVDMAIRKITTGSAGYISSRLTWQFLFTDTTSAEGTGSDLAFDNMDGYEDFAANSTQYSWMWKRAPSFFDVVAYTGSGVAGRTVSHNLGVAPEMMWVKERDNATNWNVYHTGLNGGTTPQDYFIRLNLDNAEIDNNTLWNDTAPTDTQFTVGLASDINGSNDDYIAYLFATLAGISKVGSYTGTESGNTIDCGFSSGARFVLIKRTDSSGDWYVWDSERGIVVGDDPYLLLNNTSPEVTNTDYILPDSSGFRMQAAAQNAGLNNIGGSYIFYAIA